MAVPEMIQPLVDRYTFHRDAYLRGQDRYNETQLRRDFVDPFFHSLGWDVDNNKGHSELYREVMHEEPFRMGGTTCFLDYTFRIGSNRKFIVETKKPSVRIKDDAESALQLRRYAWSADLQLSILTNCEEIAIYDCTIKPDHRDNAAKGRIRYFTYKEIPKEWDYLLSIFSPEGIMKGSFDKYAQSKKGKKGTAAVDDDILTEIETWRDALARNIALRNPTLTVEELNTVVQRTIDRLLFLRICEDRGIEKDETLFKLLEGEQVYTRLCEIFKIADTKYNSGLFHFEKEPNWNEMPDLLSLTLVIDDKVLKGIIKRLYYPETPYLFSVIPPEILGHVYEQFLGKVIRLTDGHQAKVEYKPEVKKAGGVVYTPQYIVEYIVKHTVGELVKDKTPRDVAKIRILDPACGSGSFLIGAYQFLLDWHRDWYIANLVTVFIEKKSVTDPAVLALLPEAVPLGKKKLSQVELPIYKSSTIGGATRTRSDWRLTTAEKKRILLNNIFGVDLDQQAVEVTKLSLFLKVLEEENEENIDKQLKLFAERALPSLHQNIKCGNSLIGADILTETSLSDEDIQRINPFDWHREFPYVMAAGGFDAVIGNPPYVRQELISAQKEYLKSRYLVYSGTADLYTYFFERGISLLNERGQFSFIVANKWMRANYGKPLRQYLKAKRIEEIIDFGDLPVFQNVTTYPCIIRVVGGEPVESFKVTNVESLQFEDLGNYVEENRIEIQQGSLEDNGWSLADHDQQQIIEKIASIGIPLNQYVDGRICYGIKTGLNKAFVIDAKTKDRLIYEDPRCAEIIKPFLAGRDCKRYEPLTTEKFLIFTRRGIDIKKYPSIEQYLKPYKKELMPKPSDWRKDEPWPGRKPGPYLWYEIQDSINYWREFSQNKILWPGISAEITAFTLDEEGYYGNDNIQMIIDDSRYLLGILNSSVTHLYLQNICDVVQGGFYRLKMSYISQIPIPPIDHTIPDDVTVHDQIVEFVERQLDLHRRLPGATTDQQKRLIEMQMEQIDAAIDQIVYKLYGLTEEEIAVVEGKLPVPVERGDLLDS